MSEPAHLSTPITTGRSGDGFPQHVAIIMDGNGRWAKARGLPRAAGHERGVEAMRRTVDAAGELGIEYLTVFSFSTENWRRPKEEVNALFGLLRAYVKRDLARLKREGIRVRIIGVREGVPDDIAELIKRAEEETVSNTRANLTIAFNYGSREEIVGAARQMARDVADGKLTPDQIDEARFEAALYTHDLPAPDLLIRTSGESRISNFLLWQIAYAEITIMDVLWPDFGREHLERALNDYAGRERRYGALSEVGN